MKRDSWPIRRLKRSILRRGVNLAKPYLQSHGLLRTVKCKNAVVGEPGGGRVLVLAPHMDDEVIGCGGALCKHVRAGAEVTVVFVTDGRLGSKDLIHLSGAERRKHEADVVATRKAEAKEALRVLGVNQAIYWDAPETMLAANHELPIKLSRLLASLQPDIVYLPFFLEEHADHVAISQILAAATATGAASFDCFAYEVWTPLFPNYLVDISDVIRVKEEALKKYKSQLADVDYVHTAFGLNAFRSASLLETGGYAEAFFCAPVTEYLELFRLFRNGANPVRPAAGRREAASPGGNDRNITSL